MNKLPRIYDLLSEAVSFWQDIDIPEKRLEAEMLLAYLLKVDRVRIAIDLYKEVDEKIREEYLKLVIKRKDGWPIQYLTGEKEFMGVDFFVTKDVLVPREDTTILVEAVAERFREQEITIVDVGTGSGIIALSLKRLLPKAKIFGLDISPEALKVAEKNREAQGLEVILQNSDLLQYIIDEKIKVDVVVSNPPYIPERDIEELSREVRKEPRLALSGGLDGLDYYRRLALDAPLVFGDDGYIALEIGYNQGEDVKELLKEQGFFNIEIRKDYQGLDRVVLGEWKRDAENEGI